MSDPNTNIETQTKRHIGPIIGMTAGVIVVAGLAAFFAASGPADVTDEPTPRTAPATQATD